jgi:hypothetical protein
MTVQEQGKYTTMLLGILTLITALSISAVAIYYSVAGLVAIFAAAALPIMIMGGVLEVSKLVTAVWLHRYWKQATWWLKAYLSTAVLVLMLITSMGIFGFLSKAHIEQTAQSTDNLARVETIQSEIDRNTAIVSRAENRIKQLESSGTGADASIQSQIDKEQERIDSAYTRIQPAIDEQNKIIAGVTQLFQQELDRIDEELANLQGYIDAGDIAKAQGMIGAKADGAYGPKTAAAFTAFQDAKRAERNEWLQKIQQAANSPTVKAARTEIQRLRKGAEDQVKQSQTLIARLQTQLANSDNAEEVQKSIDEQNERVRTASSEIDRLTEEKITLESEYRKLEAEVGPIKYIAEFIYGDTADNNMLEEAVRWVIITIIFVFDPLAVLLLIASQYTFEYRRKDDSGGWLRQYEQARAQRIIDNPGYNVDAPKEEANENDRRENTKETEQVDTSLPETQPSETVKTQTEADSVVATEEERKINVAKSYITTDDAVGDMVPEANTAMADAANITVEQSEVQVDETEVESQKKNIEFLEELKEKRSKELKVQETDEEWVTAKQAWKDEHPNLTLKSFKQMYIDGKIDELPWEKYKTKNFIAKEGNVQVKKETLEANEGYIQNQEQSESSIWKKIQNNKPE